MSAAEFLGASHYGVACSTWNRPVVASSYVANERVATSFAGSITAGDILYLNELWLPASDGYRRGLSSPLRVQVKTGDGEYVVADNIMLLFGHGPSLKQALEDYGAALLDYHEMLIDREEDGTIASNEEAHLALLDSLLRVQEAESREGKTYAS